MGRITMGVSAGPSAVEDYAARSAASGGVMRRAIALLAFGLISWSCLVCCAPALAVRNNSPSQTVPARFEGPVSSAEIVVGPFDLHRKYRSMEGPYVMRKFRLSDLLESPRVVLPESMVTFIEGGGAPAKMSAGPAMMEEATDAPGAGTPLGLVDTSGKARELYWFKGMNLDVLDENDRPLPTAEFICHLNLNVGRSFRNQLFREGEPCRSVRIMTLTQGQTQFYFPEGFAVPAASDEQWTFTFQAANRTTDRHRRIKHRCRLYFVRDTELVHPVKALHWFVLSGSVIVDKDSPEAAAAEKSNHPDCLDMSAGVSAPNAVPGANRNDSLGRRLSGHWVVPPGLHTYSSPVAEERDPGFAAEDRRIHAVWTHIHPLCTQTALLRCDRDERRTIVETRATTSTAGGLQLMEIETISSKQGIPLAAGQHYELKATYKNSTNKPQDSMVVMGIFCADEKFARPDWRMRAGRKKRALSGATSSQSVGSTQNKDEANRSVRASEPAAEQPARSKPSTTRASNSYPLFDFKNDGPLITAVKTMELDTTAGKIHLVLDPRRAPVHATQMYRLMKSGVLNGTPLSRYEPNFVLQTALASKKAAGQPPLSKELRGLLRRLPLEVWSQPQGAVSHQNWVLSMARSEEPDSAVGSFSILLGEAPHLDHQYTIFGHLIEDAVTRRTIDNIARHWTESHPWIVGARDYDEASVIGSSMNRRNESSGK